jgi:hypothetical protein
MSNLEQGARWEFHNVTTGDVTEYVLDEVEADGALGRLAYLLNPETEKHAIVSVRTLLREPKDTSYWTPA